jgi:hypothetical protein
LPSATAAIPPPDAPGAVPTYGPLTSNGLASAGIGAASSAELARHLTDDHDRITKGLNEVVVRRIFAAELDLQAALGGDHCP